MWPLSCVRPELVITMLYDTLKRRERELRKSKMAESVSTNKQRDIWVETKKMLSGKKPSINSVDGACNPEAISEVFASKYETLLQGTPTDPVELNLYIELLRAVSQLTSKVILL